MPTCCLWVLACYNGRVGEFWQRPCSLPRLNYLLSGPWEEKNVMTPAKLCQLSTFRKCAVLSWLSESFPPLLPCLCGSACPPHPTPTPSGKPAGENPSREGLRSAWEELRCSRIPEVHVALFHNIAEVFHDFRFKETLCEFKSFLLFNVQMKLPYHLEVPCMFSTNRTESK